MKKPHVLNRAMFNKGGTSAYGRGITSNLVSDEQRQRFNSGGRVRANVGFYSGNEFNPIERTAPDWNWNFPRASELFGYEERINRPDWMIQREKQEELEGLEDPSDYQAGQEDLLKPEKNAVITDTESDVLGAGTDWEKFAEGLYDKKSSRGEAQLGLAGNVLAAAFQPKKEAMAILGKGLGDFGKTSTQRKKKMEDIAATGKMYETIYKSREEEKGKQARLTADEKAKVLEEGDSPKAHYHALKSKQGLKKAMSEALDYPIQTLKKNEKTGAPIIPEGIVDETVMWDTEDGFVIIRDGKPIAVTDVDLQIFGLEK